MNTSYELTTAACLLIFDPHQDKEWMQRIIRKERWRVSHLLLGGDYFDAFDFQRQVAIGDMAEYLLELKDDLPVPQIVGHTPSRKGARQKGRSWCLDGDKTCYGILWRDGTLQIKGTPDP